MITPRERHTATVLNDGTVLITGGTNLAGNLATTEIYHPAVLLAGPRLLSLSAGGNGLHVGTPQAATSDKPAAVGEALKIYARALSTEA